jgi:3-dehydroquinate dehydratase-2
VYAKNQFMAIPVLKPTLMTLRKRLPSVEIDYYQSNVEGEIINKLHEIGFSYDGIVINAGAYTHTSIAIADAIAAINTPGY